MLSQFVHLVQQGSEIHGINKPTCLFNHCRVILTPPLILVQRGVERGDCCVEHDKLVTRKKSTRYGKTFGNITHPWASKQKVHHLTIYEFLGAGVRCGWGWGWEKWREAAKVWLSRI